MSVSIVMMTSCRLSVCHPAFAVLAPKPLLRYPVFCHCEVKIIIKFLKTKFGFFFQKCFSLQNLSARPKLKMVELHTDIDDTQPIIFFSKQFVNVDDPKTIFSP